MSSGLVELAAQISEGGEGGDGGGGGGGGQNGELVLPLGIRP